MRFAPSLKLCMNPKFSQHMDGGMIAPVNVEVSLTGICNAQCSWCFYAGKQSGIILSADRVIETMYEMQELGVEAVTWTGGGEPTLHPEFERIVENTPLKQGLITNGLKLPKADLSRFEWVRVSKTNWPLNASVLYHYRKAVKTLGICVNYEGLDHVVHETAEIADIVKADYVQVRPALNLEGEKTFFQVPKFDNPLVQVTGYKFADAAIDREYTECEGFHFVPFIWEDGRVDVCAYQRNKDEYNLGNIYDSSFSEIVSAFPSSVPVADDCILCCKNHEINKTIYYTRKIQDRSFV